MANGSVDRALGRTRCGHTTDGNGFVWTCGRPAGHKGSHGASVRLRDGVSTTNWGDDGLALHATKYPENGTYRPGDGGLGITTTVPRFNGYRRLPAVTVANPAWSEMAYDRLPYNVAPETLVGLIYLATSRKGRRLYSSPGGPLRMAVVEDFSRESSQYEVGRALRAAGADLPRNATSYMKKGWEAAGA